MRIIVPIGEAGRIYGSVGYEFAVHIVGCEHESVTVGLGCSVRRCNGIAAYAEKQSKQQCKHGRALKEFIWQFIHRVPLTAAG